MKKILLILALALVCSFNANAQTNGEELVKATKKRVVTAEEAVSKEAAKEAEFTEEAAKEEEFVEEKAYAEEAVKEAVPVAKCIDCFHERLEKIPALPKEVKLDKIASASSEPCVTYTAEQALDATVDGNNNTFAAVYSTNATRRCGGNKIDEAAPVLKMRAQEDDLRELKMETREDDPRKWMPAQM